MMSMHVQTKSFQIDLPDAWIDRTVYVWSAPPAGGAIPPNFVVSQDRMAQGEEFVGYVNRQVESLRQTLEGWTLLEQRPLRAFGTETYEILFTWKTPQALMKQRQIFVLHQGDGIMSLGCTATAGAFQTADAQYFQAILANFRLAG